MPLATNWPSGDGLDHWVTVDVSGLGVGRIVAVAGAAVVFTGGGEDGTMVGVACWHAVRTIASTIRMIMGLIVEFI